MLLRKRWFAFAPVALLCLACSRASESPTGFASAAAALTEADLYGRWSLSLEKSKVTAGQESRSMADLQAENSKFVPSGEVNFEEGKVAGFMQEGNGPKEAFSGKWSLERGGRLLIDAPNGLPSDDWQALKNDAGQVEVVCTGGPKGAPTDEGTIRLVFEKGR